VTDRGRRLHVNAHTHMYSGLAALGMPAPVPPTTTFIDILERVWWRLDRALDAPSLRAAARLYVAEALEASTAALIDHHESPGFIDGSLDVLADACQDLGMRAVLCYGVTERNGGRAEARRGLDECERFARTNRRPLVRAAVGLHASFTVSDDTLADAAALARALSTVLHLHVAEDAYDVDQARARGYAGVIDRLDRLDALVPGSILAHGVHLTTAEVARCAGAGCWLVHNPRSNRANQVGYPRALTASDRVALGTDGMPSDMAAEDGALHAEAATHGDDPAHVDGRLAAGRRLLAERFAGSDVAVIPDAAEHDAARARARDALPAIRADAYVEAASLWGRMQSL